MKEEAGKILPSICNAQFKVSKTPKPFQDYAEDAKNKTISFIEDSLEESEGIWQLQQFEVKYVSRLIIRHKNIMQDLNTRGNNKLV